MSGAFEWSPHRVVNDPAGQAWRVSVYRGNVWPGWSWTYRLSLLNGRATPSMENPILEGPVFALPALNGPPAFWRWLVFSASSREDHRVIVRRADRASIRDARLDELLPSRASAGAVAEEIATSIRRDGTWRGR